MPIARWRRRPSWTVLAPLVVILASFPLQGASAEGQPPQAKMRSEDSIPLTFNQGIARVAGGWILSGTNSPLEGTDVLVRTDERFHVLAINQGAIPPRWRTQGYNHIGDIDVVGNVIYAPFEQPDYTKGHQVTGRYDASTLAFRDAVVLPQHQNSFVAVDRATMIAYTMDEFDGDSLLRYDVNHAWKPLAPLQMSMLLHHTQGASIRDGFIWICTSDDRNDVFGVSLATGHVDTIGQLGHPGGEGEGIDVTPLPSGYLHAMIIDPSQTNVWIEHFDLAVSSGVPSGNGSPTVLPASGGRPALAPLGVVAVVSGAVLRRSLRQSRRRRYQNGQ